MLTPKLRELRSNKRVTIEAVIRTKRLVNCVDNRRSTISVKLQDAIKCGRAARDNQSLDPFKV